MCDCISSVNETLKPHNARLMVMINFGTGLAYPYLQTEKIVSRRDGKKAPAIQPTFCPFCGTRYVPEAGADSAAADAGGEG